MKFFEKTKGAVSIFLVIILVPMLTVSSLFVDASKLKLAKSMAESAGDLTLNTALTNYDTQLKELYGLLATAQDTTDLFSKLEDYYRTCITSAGVSDEDADTYVEQIMAQLGMIAEDDNTADIMNMELVDFEVKKYSDGNLANATILKKQIVDFMKYRAPINTGLSFISSLKSFSTLSKQSELVEKKQEYYEAQQTVLEDLKTAWSHIAAYNLNKVASDSNYLPGIKTALDGYADDYKDFGKRTIMALYKKYDTIITYQFYLEVGRISENIYDIEDGELDEEEIVYTINYDNTPYYPYWSEYYDNPYDFDSEDFPDEGDVKNAIKGYFNAKANVERKHAPAYNSLYYDIQFMAQNKADIEAYTSAMINFYLAYQKVMNVDLWLDGYERVEIYEEGDDEDEEKVRIRRRDILSGELTINSTTKKLSQWLNQILSDSSYDNWMDAFEINAEIYTQCSVDSVEEYYAQYAITPVLDISTAITNIRDEAKGYVTTIEAAIDHLDEAIKYLNSARSKLNGAVADAKNKWNNVANDSSISDTSLAKQNAAEIDQLDNYLNATSIGKLITRLENIKTDLTSFRDQIKAYKFADKFIGEIDGYAGLEKALGNKCSDLNRLSMVETKITSTATSIAASEWQSGNIKTDWIKQSAHQPNLLDDKVGIYTYMSTQFANVSPKDDKLATEPATEDTGNGKDFYDKIKDTSESKAQSASDGTDSGQAATETSKKNNISSLANRPSKTSSAEGGSETPSGSVDIKIDGSEKDGKKEDGAAGKSAKALGNLFSADFLSAVSDLAEDLRDKLFISEYIMSMFSYDTIENEYLKEHSGVEKVQPGMILSLTKNDISAANNYSYGSEVEYIIYGGENSKNLTKAYGTIYGIRFGFNLVYAFATSEIRDSAMAIATPISAATLGIIPVPLIQAVIIIGIACCESAFDLDALRNGEKVPLYKSAESWRCSITGLINYAKTKTGEILKDVAGNVISEGVNQLNSFLNMTEEELTEAVKDGTKDITDAVSNTYNQIITENANSVIQHLTTLINTAIESTYCLEANEKYESKKADMKDWVKTQLQEWGNQFTGDDIASKVKREAVKFIVNNSDKYIDKFFDTVETAAKNTSAGKAIDDMLTDLESIPGKVDQLGGAVMEFITEIRQELVDTIIKGSEEINRYISESKDKISEAAKKGFDELKNAINEHIDGIFATEGGSTTGGDNVTGAASLCSFGYSDYLRLFLLIALYANEGKVVLRTADVIQANMVHKGNKSFELKNSAAYVTMTAAIQVKPTLLALPLFADVESNPINNSKWYTITYTGTVGY